MCTNQNSWDLHNIFLHDIKNTIIGVYFSFEVLESTMINIDSSETEDDLETCFSFYTWNRF